MKKSKNTIKKKKKPKTNKLILEFGKHENCIKCSLPLTSPTSKIRVRQRSDKSKNGIQLKKEDKKNELCYIDWQIEYDVSTKKFSESKIKFSRKVNGKKSKTKYLFCLSEFIYYFYKRKIINESEIIKVKEDLDSKSEKELILNRHKLKNVPKRQSCNKTIKISNFELEKYFTSFPIYFVKLTNNIDVEIGIYEGGRATSSILPHLYVCIPLKELSNYNGAKMNGRGSKTNEKGEYIINKNNIGTFLKIFHLIGMLSKQHKEDVIKIIKTILKN